MPPVTAIATWPFGRTAVRQALPILTKGDPALDAAIAGAQAVEDDPAVDSVGFAGLPNAIGTVQLDSCVMDGETLNCGAVAGLENVRHAAAVARKVMEETRHILLVGDGAQRFALQQGFRLQEMLTPESLRKWLRRRRQRQQANPQPQNGDDDSNSVRYEAPVPFGHDTVTVLTLDKQSHLGGVCTTSGLANKVPGRVGDSPLIGAGLYVDDTAGAAGATGVGEEVIRISGSFYVVERMRAGRTPQQACEDAVNRINTTAARRGKHPAQVAFIALNVQGQTGAACTEGAGFQYAVNQANQVRLIRAKEIKPPEDA